jgi:preprotein translocase SecF subunit
MSQDRSKEQSGSKRPRGRKGNGVGTPIKAPAGNGGLPQTTAALATAGAPKGATVTPLVRQHRFFQIIPNTLKFDYLRWRWYTLAASWTVIGICMIWLGVKGFNYGIDFSGGTLIQVQLQETADIGKMREVLTASGVPSFSLQALGETGHQDFLITLGHLIEESAKAGPDKAETVPQKVERVLKEKFPTLTIRRVETVGPKVGQELKSVAVNAVLFSLGAILIYIWLRFQWRYSLGAIVATVHDVLIVLGALVITQREITLTVLAAILTVAGYSVNDTVVVFDRIRENQRRNPKKDLGEVMNEAINQTLSRTILTSATIFMVVVVMFLFGGPIINDFAFSMLVGVVIGTYSSIFSASPVVYMLYRRFPPRVK